MNRYQGRLLSLVVLGLFGLSGASCPQFLQQYGNQRPRQLPASPATPTLEQVIQVVNHNNSQIQSFQANDASLSGNGFMTLRARVAFQRTSPSQGSRFRLLAGTGFGDELDLGSNEELFWFWMRREQPPAVYYCRHDQFASSQAQRVLPVQPDWLIDAMGVGEIDPALPHQGPYRLPNDQLKIETIRNTPAGPMTKVTILDGSQGWILEQHMVDARGQTLVSSRCSQYRIDPLTNLAMPTVVQINCPSQKFSMQIDLGKPRINVPLGNAELWSLPNYPNTQLVNLGGPTTMPVSQQSQVPMQSQPVPSPSPARSSSANLRPSNRQP
jgi:hypothetical protein